MIYLKKEDYFEIHFNSMLSNYDRDTISLLYQPLIGADGAMLYFTLWSMQKIQKSFDIFSVESVLIPLTGFNLDEIQSARIKLEGTGLIQTFYKEENNFSTFLFELYAPKYPNDFLNDPLFYGYFSKKIGEKNAKRISSIFKSKQLDKKEYNDISAKFEDAFNDVKSDLSILENTNDFNDPSFARVTKDVTNTFDYIEFLSLLKTKMISVSRFNDLMEKQIKSIATLYGVSEISMSDYVAQSYNGEDKISPIDFNKVQMLAKNDFSLFTLRDNSKEEENYDFNSDIGDKINKMSSLSSMEYLKLKMRYKNPPPSDAKILRDLQDMGLKSGVINVIVDYCLTVHDGKLIGNYCTKIGGSMNVKGITSVLDAMNYLQKGRNSYNKSKKSEDNETESGNISSNEKVITEDEKKELDDFIATIVD